MDECWLGALTRMDCLLVGGSRLEVTERWNHGPEADRGMRGPRFLEAAKKNDEGEDGNGNGLEATTKDTVAYHCGCGS
ncbi:hypothetical protein CRG98_034065 [Punica granatum]|uniref:Uncharacterized protein n=1 Tax=Punica granatum TaxID=22663 RepID=A0A2I0INJ3_PUNGR|nr:hypothetical protein CRG98_034065 [Punica granatum]